MKIKILLALFLLFFNSMVQAAITQVQYKHQYGATSGVGYAFNSNNSAGSLLVLSVSTGISTTFYSVTDTAGNTWSSLPFHHFNTNKAIQIFYVLNANAGPNTVTVTSDGNDMGFTMVEYSSSGLPWTVDSGLTNGKFFDGVTGGGAGTTQQYSGTYSTSGANDLIFVGQADENITQGSHTPTAGFTEIQWDNGHVDAQEEWLGAPAQTNNNSGWDVGTSTNTWAIYLAAFTAVPLNHSNLIRGVSKISGVSLIN